ncbi:MAG: hypothetical protein K8H87_13330, partial [Pseudorhodoplanes sp.]|nr:hypothetical protein [Pseudorhodoplanes sp.]
PSLDEMGVASYHEVLPNRPGKTGGKRPTKPDLDAMGPGVESVPARSARSAEGATGTQKAGPRSTSGKPGQRGGWSAKKFRK